MIKEAEYKVKRYQKYLNCIGQGSAELGVGQGVQEYFTVTNSENLHYIKIFDVEGGKS